MAAQLPPELMTAEQRAERIVEVQREIGREWMRFAITEAVVLWVPFAVFLTFYLGTDAIPDGALVPAVVIGIAVATALVLYWLVKRVLPLQRELHELRGNEDTV
jgi:O-antigen/teichoic acid export membrane protein